jgi:hypothetical protein
LQAVEAVQDYREVVEELEALFICLVFQLPRADQYQ